MRKKIRKCSKMTLIVSGSTFGRLLLATLAGLVILAGGGSAFAWDGPGSMVIDHSCTDMSKIPSARIAAAREDTRMYYGHTSHGMQITEGLRLTEVMDPFFAYAITTGALPSEAGAFRVHDFMAEPEE